MRSLLESRYIVNDVCQIIDGALKSAFQAVNFALCRRNWLLGKRIAEEELVSDKQKAANETWSVRTLQRNIETQYYYRLLKSQVKETVVKEMKEKTEPYTYSTYQARMS